jgi:hypothetical protein
MTSAIKLSRANEKQLSSEYFHTSSGKPFELLANGGDNTLVKAKMLATG